MRLKSDMVNMANLKATIEHGEGLGWALEEYDADQIEDSTLADLWGDATNALWAIKQYLEID